MVAVSYNNLWKLLIDKGMNKTELKEASGISFNVMARMGKNETVSLESLEKICMVLNCNIGDIMDITTQTETRTFSTIELFAGAGGLALGVEKAGFNTLGLVTGQEDAFYQMCMVLPSIIQKAVGELEGSIVPHDTVIDELKELAKKQNIDDENLAVAMAVYMLGFGSYNGFKV